MALRQRVGLKFARAKVQILAVANFASACEWNTIAVTVLKKLFGALFEIYVRPVLKNNSTNCSS